MINFSLNTCWRLIPTESKNGSSCFSVASIFINHLFNHLFTIFELSHNPKTAFTQLKMCQRETLTLFSTLCFKGCNAIQKKLMIEQIKEVKHCRIGLVYTFHAAYLHI